MDLYFRRVYFTLAVFLVILWFLLVAWVSGLLFPGIFSFISIPSPKSPRNQHEFAHKFHVPGITFSIYHPLAGENFAVISMKLKISEKTLRTLNQANDNSEPEVDTAVIVPSKDGIYHIFRTGQSLTDIGRAYGVPLKDILKANEKRGDSDLEQGDILYLPGARYLSNQDREWKALASLEVKKGFLKPTTGRFADGFGERLHPITHKMTFHEGLDLAPGWRARVVASQDGMIVFTGIRAGFGRLIIIDHGLGLSSWYAHLDEILVKVSQKVKRGDLIGKVGKTGRTTGPHLHFEVRLKGKPQNPFLYLTQ